MMHQVEACLDARADCDGLAGRTVVVSATLEGQSDPDPVPYKPERGPVPEGTIDLGSVVLKPWG